MTALQLATVTVDAALEAGWTRVASEYGILLRYEDRLEARIWFYEVWVRAVGAIAWHVVEPRRTPDAWRGLATWSEENAGYEREPFF